MKNRLHNCHNKYQGSAHKVLCVCSAGLLRSPTAARILQQEYGYNTRAAGLESNYALIPVDEVLLEWADEVVCMTADQAECLAEWMKNDARIKPLHCLNIEDDYAYMDPTLVELIKENYGKILQGTD